MTLAASSRNNVPIIPSKTYASIPKVIEVPNLIQIQLESFDWFKTEGIQVLLQEISPIDDFTGNRFDLSFLDHAFREPKYNMWECREKEITYSAPLYVTGQLKVKETGEIKEQMLFFGDIPIMTPHGTFIINGAERVVVSQLVRSPGAYFTLDVDSGTGRGVCSTKIIPYRGAWLEFETGARDLLSVKVDRKRKAPVTTLLRALGYVRDHEINALFEDVDNNPDHQYIAATMDKDPVDFDKLDNIKESDLTSLWELVRPGDPYDKEGAQILAGARLDFYRRLRPGEPANVENANALLDSLFFNPRRYDLGKVGRFKLNRRLGSPSPTEVRTLTKEDLVAVIKEMIRISNGQGKPDDIDHLGSRRVRAVGELIQNQLRVGILRMERVIKERMTIIEPENVTPAALVNIRPVVAAVREFFGGSQLSQFMDQTNPLAELTHKRRLSALGPGGLSRERAGFEVRDVHNSHYGRICPIETPEGPNIGLLGSMATYGHINEYGFIETPYRRVLRELPSSDQDLVGRAVWTDLPGSDGKPLVKAGKTITKKIWEQLQTMPAQQVALRPFVTGKPEDILSMQADDEEIHVIAQANIPLDAKGQFIPDKVETRTNSLPTIQPIEELELMDISPMQIVSVSTSLIPFLEHDDANRALMGSNMQRQAVPLLKPEAPLVGTGMEGRVALDSGQVVLSLTEGTVTGVSGNEVIVTDKDKNEARYNLVKFLRSNQSTCVNQRPAVTVGQKVNVGDPLADSSSTDQGVLALGHNVLVAFMSWEGYNYEDAIIIGEALIQDDKFTSIHIEKYECEARQTKLGDEEITRDIPNIGEETLRDLDEEGVIRVGAEVGPGDILVGKITPKGETELTAEEKLLRAIFGEKARDVKDTSLRVPHGERGKIIDVRVSDRENKEELSPGVNRMVRVWIAQTRKLTVGDKMAGRHGNKGVVSRVLPVEDMPYLENGTPVQIVLNPIGVPSRMNLGQVLETHLGWVANFMGFRAVSPVFDGATDADIEDGLGRVWMIQTSGAVNWHDPESPEIDWDTVYSWIRDKGYEPDDLFDEKVHGQARVACMEIWLKYEAGVDPSGMEYSEIQKEAKRLSREHAMTPPILGKMTLRDGRTGEEFAQPVTVGYIYIMKLIHLVEDKIHARSTGPYSLITQQPLGGKAQFGGQRFGEMEVWALEAYSFAYNLQEMLTVKSDDVVGRQKTYEAIVKGEDVIHPGIPESFQVLLKEMQALGLSMELLSDEEGFDLEESLHHPPLGDVLSDEVDDSDIAAIIAELDPPVVEAADSSETPAAGEPEVFDEPEEQNEEN
jgi:DNA-directed RNA polymerase subunit beta